MRNEGVSEPAGIPRRTWIRLIPVLSAMARSNAQTPTHPNTSAQQNFAAPKITKENLRDALRLVELEFSDEQMAMMLPGINRNLPMYEELRKKDVPLDTEPAFRFLPLAPANDSIPRNRKRAFRTRRVRTPDRPKSIDQLAFAPVTQLAALVRAKRVSSVELTTMYLNRLKKYGPKLNCVITLTEDLAMKQAVQADREIGAGHYKGPLHGIPYGAKDLFATAGIRTTWGAEPSIGTTSPILTPRPFHGSRMLELFSLQNYRWAPSPWVDFGSGE